MLGRRFALLQNSLLWRIWMDQVRAAAFSASQPADELAARLVRPATLHCIHTLYS